VGRNYVIPLILLLALFISCQNPLFTSSPSSKYDNEDKGHYFAENSRNNNTNSNLSWGPNSGLNVYAQAGIYITMAVNITNGAGVDDNVAFTMNSDTEWSCFWYNTSTPCDQENQINISPGGLAWPKYVIDVPEVINGSPLAFIKHNFQIIAKSSIDNEQVTYNFSLEVDEVFQTTYESNNINLSFDPGIKKRTTLTLRNTGNSPAQLVAKVVPLDDNGTPINGFTPDLSYQYEGWLVGVFNVHNLNGPSGNGIGVNSLVTFDVEIQPPDVTSGTTKVGVIAWSAYNPSDSVMVVINSTISWDRGGSLSIDGRCDGIKLLPFDSCNTTISVTNLGNYADSYELVVDAPDWLQTEISQNTFSISKGTTQEISPLTIKVNEMMPAFTQGFATVTLKLGTGEIIDSTIIELNVSQIVDWELRAVENSTDSQDNVSVLFTIRNVGNGNDGLQVSLHVDVSVDHGLVPPEFSEHGSETGAPRFFIIDEIQPGANFSFRSWMYIPENPEANGTITMTVDMQSALNPDIIFTNETKVDYLGISYRVDTIPENSFWLEIELYLANLWNQFNGIGFSVIITVIGSLILFQAVKHRQRKDAEWKARMTTPEPPEPEKPGQWMSKFNRGEKSQVPVIKSENANQVSADEFKEVFSSKSSPKPKKRNSKPSEGLLEAANTVFEHHEKAIENDLLDELANKLVKENEPHPAMELLTKKESVTGRTNRKEKYQKKKKTDGGNKKGKKVVKPVKVGIITPNSEKKEKVEKSTNDEEFDLDF